MGVLFAMYKEKYATNISSDLPKSLTIPLREIKVPRQTIHAKTQQTTKFI